MTGKRFERLLARFTQYGEAHLDHLGRALRASGLLPTGGRGTSALQIDHTHAANVLIALAIGGPPLSAAARVPAYRMLQPGWCGIGTKPPAGALNVFGDTFGEAVEFMLLGRVPNLREVQIVKEWPRAVIELNSGRPLIYGFASSDEVGVCETSSVVHSRTILPTAVFSRVRAFLEGSGANEDGLVAMSSDPQMRSVTWH